MKRIGKRNKYALAEGDLAFTVGEHISSGEPAVMRVRADAFDKPAPPNTLGYLLNRCAASESLAALLPDELRRCFGLALVKPPEEVLSEWREIREVLRARRARG